MSGAFNLVACGGITPSSDSSNVNAKPESSYCSTVYSTPTPHTITGTASYNYRAQTCGAFSCSGLSGTTSTRGIPHAELVVRNSAGNVVQCGHTNSDGTFSVTIDKIPGDYTITVNSRADNTEIKASVLNDITNNTPYSLTSNSITVASGTASPQAIGSFTANLSTTEQKGAAFHLLYNFWTANEFLRSQSGNANFVADKVTAYWKAGFNPGSYVGTSSGLSFYIKGSRDLYILGGLNGNYSTTDFDHFDDSVILHEYAHFLEDVYSKSDSQGGSHNGNFVIDPRLAWSEGFANFFQGAVIRQLGGTNDNVRGGYYIDITNGSNSGLVFDLNESGTTAATDRVQFAGEGNFREISVSRTLWKTTSTTDGNVPFSALWTAFTSATQGIKNSLNYFRSAGLFNYYLNQIITASHSARLTAWQLILSNESQNADTRDYADPVSAITMGTCGKYPKSLDPVIDSSYSYARSNLLLSNDFYLYVHNGSGGTLNLTYTQATSPAIDLDLYLYRDGHVYQDDYLESIGQSTGGVVAKSDRTYPSIENGVEAISLSGLAAGVYLINVKANTFNKLNSEINNGIANYTLRLTQGATTWDLCPEN
ncbi:MAG: carboxypeptidase-like regulatory domain-containing protein [Bdellovibrionales bacterium]